MKAAFFKDADGKWLGANHKGEFREEKFDEDYLARLAEACGAKLPLEVVVTDGEDPRGVSAQLAEPSVPAPPSKQSLYAAAKTDSERLSIIASVLGLT